jgi:hypothetical protein
VLADDAFLNNKRFPPGTPVPSTIKIEQILISLIIGSSEGGFRSRDESKRAEKNRNMNEE